MPPRNGSSGAEGVPRRHQGLPVLSTATARCSAGRFGRHPHASTNSNRTPTPGRSNPPQQSERTRQATVQKEASAATESQKRKEREEGKGQKRSKGVADDREPCQSGAPFGWLLAKIVRHATHHSKWFDLL